MTIRAANDPRYSRRFLLMGLAAIAFALWFLYDGAITYPNQRERALAHDKLMAEGRSDDWPEYARGRGWPASYPGEPKTEGEIIMQYVMAGMVGVVAILLLSIPLRARGRWIEAGDTGITSSWGQGFGYDHVLELNKRQWRSKGIAKVTYHDGRRKRRFVLDDYKFDRHATDAILYELEQRIAPEKITGGPPEPPSEEIAEKEADSAPAAQPEP